MSPHAPHAAQAPTQMSDTCCRLMRLMRPARRHRCVTFAVVHACAPTCCRLMRPARPACRHRCVTLGASHAPRAPRAPTRMCDTCCRLMRPTRPARRHRCVTLAVASWAPRADTQGNITSQTSTTSQAYTRARLSLVCIAPMTSQAGFISQANIHSQCSPVLLTRTCVFEKAHHRTCWHQLTS